MRIVFLYQRFESLGIELLSAILKQRGHEVSLIFDPQLFINYTMPNTTLSRTFDFQEKLMEELLIAKPDLICFSCASDQFGWALRLAKGIKKILNVPIIFGGPHATAAADNVIEHDCIDFLIRGEGEDSLIEFVDSLEKAKDFAKIRNLCFKVNSRITMNPLRPLICDLDSLPLPDKGLFYNQKEFFNNFYGFDKVYTIVASRGCPNNCSYCHNSYIKNLYKGSNFLRYRSAANVIKELSIAKEKYGIKTIIFWDDDLTYNRPWLRELLERYKEEIGLPFSCLAYPRRIDEQTIDLLAEAGCRVMNFGFQSINERIRRDVLSRHNSNEDMIKVIDLLSRSKIILFVDLIIGLPTETIEDLLEAAQFFNENKVNLINIYWLRYLPKTEITKYIQKEVGIKAINEGLVYAPWHTGGSSYDKKKAKLVYLIITANIIPRAFFRFLLKTKAYRFFPEKSIYYAGILLSLGFTNLFSKRKYRIPQIRILVAFLRYHKYYISKFLSWKFRRFAKKTFSLEKYRSGKNYS